MADGFLNLGSFASVFPIALAAVGTGFILHELAHKYVAIHFGAEAEYRAWPFGLVIALITSLVGFVFAAPGATYVFGGKNIGLRENGIISLAGPLTNILIAVIFFIPMITFSHNYIGQILSGVVFINLFLALFNLLPIPPLDGSKVFEWNKGIWAITFIPLAYLFITSGFI